MISFVRRLSPPEAMKMPKILQIAFGLFLYNNSEGRAIMTSITTEKSVGALRSISSVLVLDFAKNESTERSYSYEMNKIATNPNAAKILNFGLILDFSFFLMVLPDEVQQKQENSSYKNKIQLPGIMVHHVPL